MIMRRDRNGTLYWKVDNTDWLEILRPDWQVVGHTGSSCDTNRICIGAISTHIPQDAWETFTVFVLPR
ncbi:hypothetical protein PC119_g19138 [Phytophthora cactorum]|nr:hypothetical protein PC119_g19138 [Phytophthora cactorum]